MPSDYNARKMVSRKVRYTIGLVSLLFVSICWVLEEEFLQGLQIPTSKNYYPKPYFMCWLTTSGYIIFFLPWIIQQIVEIKSRKQEITFKKIFGKEENKLFIVVGLLSPIWLFSGYTWFLSLSSTSVTANTIISNSGFLWCFLFSAMLLQEKISTLKIFSCVFCFVGLILATISGDNSDEEGITQTWLGYVLAILAAILNAFYDVMFKKFGPLKQENQNLEKSNTHSLNINANDLELSTTEKSNDLELRSTENSNSNSTNQTEEGQAEKIVTIKNTLFFLTFTGVFVFILFWPGMIILNYTGTELFEIPDGSTSFLLFLNVLLDVSSNFGILLAVSYTTPFFTDVGILLTIPISIVFDVLVHSYLLPWFGWAGLLLLIVGFVFILFADFIIEYREREIIKNGPTKNFVLALSGGYFTLSPTAALKCFGNHNSK